MKLRNFSHAARQLGSSVGILSSAYQLRERIAQVLYLFRENAVNLFPQKVQRRTSAQLNNLRPNVRQNRPKPLPHVRTPVIPADLDLENFPEQISQLGEDVTTFLEYLNEFPEFTDEVANAAVLDFQKDLNVCLRMRLPSCYFYYWDRFPDVLIRSIGRRALDNILVHPLSGSIGASHTE